MASFEELEDGRGSTGYVLRLAGVAAVGGLLFGYDTGVIAAAIGYLETRFELDATMKGWAASSALVGCIPGAALAGLFSDWIGRRKVLLVAAVLFTISAVFSAVPRNLTEFAIARFVGGLGVGAASIISPLYIAEVAPPRMRGRLVSLNQLAIVTGFFVVYWANYFVAIQGDEAWNVATGWRWMFGLETAPALFFFGLLFFVPESPRWLTEKDREGEALHILTRVNGPDVAAAELKEIRETIAAESGSLKELLAPGLRIALVIGIVLAVLQQVTGINSIMYYAPEIFRAAGSSDDSSMLQAVSVSGVNLVFTFVAIWLVDKIGRKPLLLAGSIGMGVSLIGVAASFHYEATDGPWLLVCILLYIASFAASLGPVVWVVISEIFPTRVRGAAMGFCTTTLWVACYVVSQTFPMLIEEIGEAKTFTIYAVLCAVMFGFVWFVLPETKGRSLEEIERSWTGGA